MVRRERGIEGMDIEGPAGGGAGTEGTSPEGQVAGTMSLPWQQVRPGEEITPESPLVGKVRVVPIHDQNAVLVLAAPEYREAVRALIVDELDTPGRQVRISATLVEVQWNDELVLGWRLSNSDSILGGAPVDHRVGGTAEFSGRSFTDSSILDVDLSANVVLQALRQQAEVRVLQQPAVFTADNEAASFFEGQDIPVLTQTQTTTEGTINESVEYQSVGIVLNVRPRITVQGGVDLEINLEISNVVPGQTEFSSPLFDRRETTTHVIVEDGQTVVLSGILRELEGRIERGVPLLKDIPLLGEVFKHHESATIQTELLMFVTPEVIETSKP
jgi:general secretion pathway protein D